VHAGQRHRQQQHRVARRDELRQERRVEDRDLRVEEVGQQGNRMKNQLA